MGKHRRTRQNCRRHEIVTTTSYGLRRDRCTLCGWIALSEVAYDENHWSLFLAMAELDDAELQSA